VFSKYHLRVTTDLLTPDFELQIAEQNLYQIQVSRIRVCLQRHFFFYWDFALQYAVENPMW